MMKKKVLFITTNLRIDGASISLINLLKSFDYNKYEVSLGLFLTEGDLLKEVPKEVNVFSLDEVLKDLVSPTKSSINQLFRKKRGYLLVQKLIFALNSRLNDKKGAFVKFWRAIKKSISPLKDYYDIAISYQDNLPRYYLIDKTKAGKKILWNHTTLTDINEKIETEYFNQADACITVSDSSKNELKRVLNGLITPCYVVENILLQDSIKEKSVEFIPVNRKNGEMLVTTVARLSYVKGIDLIPNACKLVKDSGIPIKWYIVGDGPEYSNISKLLRDLKLENEITLVGEVNNPYPYILNADYYVQPSRNEAKSIAVEEAKLLDKIVICTNYPTVYSQIINEQTGFIVDSNSKSIADKLIELYSGTFDVENINSRLKELRGNECEINKLYSIIEENKI